MKKSLTIIFILLGCFAFSQNSNYDKALADSLGADEYGMKSYYMVILKTGPTEINDSEKLNELFRGHLDNISKLSDEGKIVVAGPFGENQNKYRGMFIFNADNEQEVEELLLTDPTIKAGIFDTEIYPWYGSAALPTYLDNHDKIAKENP